MERCVSETGMGRRGGWLPRVSLVVAFVLATGSQAAQPRDFAGDWILDTTRTERFEDAVDRALEPEGFVTRMMAKGRIMKAAKVPRSMAIRLEGDAIQVTTDLQNPPPMILGGPQVIWMRPKGAPLRMSASIREGHLLQVVDGDFGTRTQDFSLSADQRALVLDVEVATKRLQRKLTHRLLFSRKPGS